MDLTCFVAGLRVSCTVAAIITSAAILAFLAAVLYAIWPS